MEELNLLPVMNLFVVLIPFLLAAAAFYHVSVVPTSTPQHTPGDSSQEADLDAVTVTVTVETERFVVTAANSSIAFDELDALVPRRGPFRMPLDLPRGETLPRSRNGGRLLQKSEPPPDGAEGTRLCVP